MSRTMTCSIWSTLGKNHLTYCTLQYTTIASLLYACSASPSVVPSPHAEEGDVTKVSTTQAMVARHVTDDWCTLQLYR